MLLALLAGCTHLPPAEREELDRAAMEYRTGQVAQALPRLDRIIKDYSQVAEIGEAYYLRGLCRAKLGQTGAAKDDFRKAADSKAGPEVAARARASLASLAFQERRWEEAAGLYADSVDDLPNESPTDEILYSAGVALQRAGRWSEARRQFARILRHFRESPAAQRARRNAEWQHDYFAIQLGAFEQADRAVAAVRSFKEKRLDAWQENHPRDGKAMWIVMTGQYRSYAEAEQGLRQARQVQADAFIIP